MKALLTIPVIICALVSNGATLLKSYPYDAQAITNAYSARVVAAGGTLQTNDLNAIGTFVRHAITNGYWGYLWDCSPLAGDNTNAAVQKLKIAPGSYSSLAIKSFTAADYSRTGSFFGKSGAWLDTGLRQIDLPFTNRSGAGVWFIDTMTNLIDASTAEYALGLATSVTPNFCIATAMTASREQSVITDYLTIAATVGGGIRWSQGLNYFSRTSPTRADWWINGLSAGFNTSAQSNPTPKTNQFLIYSANAGTSIQGKMIGWYDINLGIPASIQSNYYAGVRELMRGIGRIPQPVAQRAFLVVGQSLATGSGTNITVYDNSKKGTTRALGLGTPIVAFGSSDYFRKGRTRLTEQTVETGWRAFADHFIALCDAEGYGTTNDCLVYNWARGGAGYTLLKKTSTNTSTIGSVTTNTYGFSMNDIVKQQAFQQELVGNSLLFPAILSVHGETDITDTNYDSYMTEWKTDYETDIKSVTGQSGSIPIFHSQTIAAGFPGGTSTKPYSDLLMLSLHENSGGSNVLVGPKYMLASCDGTHLTNSSYRIMGEYYAEAVFHQVIKADGWDCLRPTNVVRTNAEITVTFNKSNLVLDTNWVTDPGSYGFTYFDDTSPPAISTVALGGATTNLAVITLAGTPTGAGKVIRYAMNATALFTGGPQTGPRGCLRDQSTQVGTSSGTNLWNYCVVFEKTVP